MTVSYFIYHGGCADAWQLKFRGANTEMLKIKVDEHLMQQVLFFLTGRVGIITSFISNSLMRLRVCLWAECMTPK